MKTLLSRISTCASSSRRHCGQRLLARSKKMKSASALCDVTSMAFSSGAGAPVALGRCTPSRLHRRRRTKKKDKDARREVPPDFLYKRLADYFLVAQGFTAQGFSAPFLLLAAFSFLPLSAFLSALTAQGFFAAEESLAAQGFAWAKLRLGVSKNVAVAKTNSICTTLSFIKPSLLTAKCGFLIPRTKIGAEKFPTPSNAPQAPASEIYPKELFAYPRGCNA